MMLLLVILYYVISMGSSNKVPAVVGYQHFEENKKRELFVQFLEKNKKNYTEFEYFRRYEIFKDNLAIIDQRNDLEKKSGGTAVHAINKFADMSLEECNRFLFGVQIDDELKTFAKNRLRHHVMTNGTIATYANWAGQYTTAIKDQGDCGGCWAFSVVEQVESDAIRLQGWNVNFNLSPQQLIDCVGLNNGCNGGSVNNAYNYVQTFGLEFDVDYPFTGVTGTCYNYPANVQVKMTQFYFMNYNDASSYASTEANMANYVLTTGPLATYVDATSWQSYSSGILSSCTSTINHAVQIVGLDTVNNYWIARNSWGTSWGEGGYIRLQYMNNQCNLASYPSYITPSVVNPDVTMRPSSIPTSKPSRSPTFKPTYKPTTRPTSKPSTPTRIPSKKPTYSPTIRPSVAPII